jgi:hypothetical protein
MDFPKPTREGYKETQKLVQIARETMFALGIMKPSNAGYDAGFDKVHLILPKIEKLQKELKETKEKCIV